MMTSKHDVGNVSRKTWFSRKNAEIVNDETTTPIVHDSASNCDSHPEIANSDTFSKSILDNKVQDDINSAKWPSSSPFKFRQNLSHIFRFDESNDPITKTPTAEKTTEAECTANSINSFEKIDFEEQKSHGNDTGGVYLKNLFAIEDNFALDSFINFPSSRLALLNQEHSDLFLSELSLIKKNQTDFQLYFPWVVWLDKKSGNSDNRPSSAVTTSSITTISRRRLEVQPHSIKTRNDLESAKCNFRDYLDNNNSITHIFREGIRPRRSIPELIHGGTLEFQVPDSLDSNEKVWSYFLDICVLDKLHHPMNIQQPVCGVSWKRRLSTDFSVISLWIYVGNEGIQIESLLTLCDCLRENLPEELKLIIDTARYVENRTLNVKVL